MSLVSAPEIRKSIIVDEDGEEVEKPEQVQVFSECPFFITLKEFEKTGLDVLFFGQDHCDTMEILQKEKEMTLNKIS